MKKTLKITLILLIIVLLATPLVFIFNKNPNDNGNNNNNNNDIVIEDEDNNTDNDIIPVDFSELKFTAFGDSITYGADLIIGTRVEKPYPTIVSEILGLKDYRNKGVSGATLSINDDNLPTIIEQITSWTGTADIIGVLGGVNDFSMEQPLGDINSKDTTTVYGALHYIMSYLRENHSNSYIFFMTPYKLNSNKYHWTNTNQAGYKLVAVSNAIKELALLYNYPVLDLFEKGNFESVMYDEDCDGIHPNQNFITTKMAPQIAQFIKDNYKK